MTPSEFRSFDEKTFAAIGDAICPPITDAQKKAEGQRLSTQLAKLGFTEQANAVLAEAQKIEFAEPIKAIKK